MIRWLLQLFSQSGARAVPARSALAADALWKSSALRLLLRAAGRDGPRSGIRLLTSAATKGGRCSIVFSTFAMVQKLPRSFYDRDTVLVARELLGKLLVHHVDGERRVGRIVEVEAYLGPHDLAAHSSKGLTPRTKTMFGPPGHAYVYFIYGMHYCMNVVTEREGHASAVLLRALEPVQNIQARTQGPGLVCKAMQIDRRLNGHDLLSEDFYIAAERTAVPLVIVKRARIGVDYARHWARRQLRFYVKGNPFVSRR